MPKRPRGSALADTIETAIEFIRSPEFKPDAEGAADLARYLTLQGEEAVRRYRDNVPAQRPRIGITVEGGVVTMLVSTVPIQATLFDADIPDHREQFPDGEPLHVKPDVTEYAPEPEKTHTLSTRDVSTILAALRHWQNTVATEDDDGDDQTPLPCSKIDDLCERINFAD